jgi:hypothetical protein
VIGGNPDGTLLTSIGVTTPRKTAVVAIWDGTKFTPLLIDGDPLPGMPTVRMNTNVYNMPVYYRTAGGVFAKMRVAGAPYKSGLFWVEAGRAELITPLGVREGGLLGPAKETFDAHIFGAATRRAQVLNLQSDYQGASTLMLRTKDGVKNITPPLDKAGSYRFHGGVFVTDDPPLYLFMSSRATTKTFAEIATKETQTVFDTYWLVGVDGKLREIPSPLKTMRIVSGFRPKFTRFTAGVRGILITKALDPSEVENAVLTLGPLGIGGLTGSALFLPEGSETLVAAPALETDTGEVALESLLGFMDDDRAVAKNDRGILLLTRGH